MKENKLTAEEKKKAIQAISNDILNDKDFIYESMDFGVLAGRGDRMLTCATMILKRLKEAGAPDEALKQCYEIGVRNDSDGIKYMIDELLKKLKN